MTSSYIHDGSDRYQRYYRNVQWFIENILAGETTSIDDYVAGRRKLDFSDTYIGRSQIAIEDLVEAGGLPYEEAIYARVTAETSCRFLIVVGGLGSGKTTAVKYILTRLARERHVLSARFPCTCTPCTRRPIYVDCLNIQRGTKPDAIYRKVLQGIRFGIYNNLVDGLLAANGLPNSLVDSTDRIVLRRLIIANDIAAWADLESPGTFPHVLRADECDVGQPLLATPFTADSLRGMISAYRKPARHFEKQLVELIRDPDEALNLTNIAIGMYLQSCNATSPNNVIVVDNIDQVPTEFIERLADYLGELAELNPQLRLVVPLRPSSITRSGFVKAPRYLSHYGPDCFEMIQRRLQKNILGRPRVDLSEASRPDAVTPFVNKPSPEEVDLLILTTYPYSLVVTAGRTLTVNADADDATSRSIFPSGVHPDHRFARGLKFNADVVRHFAETLAAVVGTSARYATEQMRRYYEHIYSSPGLVAPAAASLKFGARASVRLPYGQTVTSLLGRAEGDSGHNGLANLYRPTEHTGSGDWPTLAKLRALRYLRANGSSLVGDVVTALGQYGIPADIAIEALNYLHCKERLLVWFSRNSDLTLTDSDLAQEVVISEHGEQYLDHVVGDFEYIWFCASHIPSLPSGESPSGFKARLEEYSRLLSRVATTEWKQLSFQRAAANALWDEGSAGRTADFITLSLLYRSLTRAVTSAARGVLRGHKSSPAALAYQTEVEETIATICDAVLLHQDRFRCAFGDSSYLTLERSQIASVRPHLAEMLRHQRLSDRCRISIRVLINSWSEEPNVTPRFVPDEASSAPPVDLVTNVSKYLRGVVPGIASIIGTLDKVEGGRVLLWTVLQRRKGLADLLAHRLPTFTIVKRGLTLLEADLKVAEEAARAIAATGSESVAWLENELGWVRNALAVMNENKFETNVICRRAEMSEKKRRANNILSVFAAVAQRLGIADVGHLVETWQ